MWRAVELLDWDVCSAVVVVVISLGMFALLAGVGLEGCAFALEDVSRFVGLDDEDMAGYRWRCCSGENEMEKSWHARAEFVLL